MSAESTRLVGESFVAKPQLRTVLLSFLLISVVTFPIVLGLAMTRGMNHDEHQHIGAGALVARDGLLPYRDFPHFHTPYLPFIYAALFRGAEQLLTAARLFSVACSTAILGIIGSFAFILFRSRGTLFASLAGIGSVLLALTTTLFTQTAGRAWNHEPSLLLALLAFVVQVAGLKSGRLLWFIVSGVLLGFAIGTRITCAPLIAPFGIAPLFFRQSPGSPMRPMAAFSVGLLAGLAGVIYFFATVPEQALFANFGFAEANITYRFSDGAPRTMTLPTKLRFFFKEIIRPDAALFIAGVLPVAAAFLVNRRTGRRVHFVVPFILLMLPFILMGSLAPSPAFDQYFFPLVPFLLIIGLHALVSIPPQNAWFRRFVWGGLAAVALSVGMGARAFHDYDDYFVRKEWQGSRLDERASEIRKFISTGRVLTLAPSYPLEAGLSIFPAFSTGPFAWRVSPFIEPAKAARLGIVTPSTLDTYLRANPPAALLLGFEEEGEEPLKAFAQQNGYRKIRLKEDDNQLWVPAGN